MKRLFGLIGNPLHHSWSKKHFEEKFKTEAITDAEYDLFPLTQIADLPSLIENNSRLAGLNVTIPYKTSVIPYLDSLDPVAEQVNAVNTIKIVRSGNQTSLHGYNTDVSGFEASIKPILRSHHKSALILGTGGAALAAAWVFSKLKMDYSFVSRHPIESNQLAYNDINKDTLQKFTVIVNATPVGMHPEINVAPALPYHLFDQRHMLFDMVYNPAETQFLLKGRKQNATIKNGLEMLQLQAEKAWEIWNQV